jgi:hypothetical protein
MESLESLAGCKGIDHKRNIRTEWNVHRVANNTERREQDRREHQDETVDSRAHCYSINLGGTRNVGCTKVGGGGDEWVDG